MVGQFTDGAARAVEWGLHAVTEFRFRGDEINIPHEQFDHMDAEKILDDTEAVLAYVRDRLE